MGFAEIDQVSYFGIIALGLLLETIRPLRQADGLPMRRWLNNLGLALLNYFILVMLGPLLYKLASDVIGIYQFGILKQLGASNTTSFVVLLLSLEFFAYWFHRASHAYPWLWRLHAVHHSDTEQDVTTTQRHHPIEILLLSVLSLPLVLLLGPDMSVLIAYSIFHGMVSTLSHANLSFGRTMNEALGRLLVTPDFHRVHHSIDRQFTDSNFGTICSVFDHLFGTAKLWDSDQQLNQPMGLKYFRGARDSRIDRLLVMPWRSDFPK